MEAGDDPPMDRGGWAPMKIRPPDAWTLLRVLGRIPRKGYLAALRDPWKARATHLDALNKKARPAAWKAMLAALPDDAPELVQAVGAVNPNDPMPAYTPPQFATAADIRRTMASNRWLCDGWIPASRVVGLAALEGIGKTRVAMDLCRRGYL